ncbi:MAG: 3,4-dihydroxy-2-butanone-4-phosphate synthase [Alphaproteobacteria bacterium]
MVAIFNEFKSSIPEIIEEARNGRMFVLVDDEDRENEGDIIVPAQMATPEVINFMATYGRGLICLAMPPAQIGRLALPLMPQRHESRFGTAFTLSIEAATGVTTGISAPDRARTIAVAIDPNVQQGDIQTPGHVFPLLARENGTLERTGHTEAAVDIARLAGLNPSGVICEIMNEDGDMARRDDLVAFCEKHGLKIGTIADLVAYRLATESLIEQVNEEPFETEFGDGFRIITFREQEDPTAPEILALVKGDIAPEAETLTRVHALNMRRDLLGGGGKSSLPAAIRTVNEEGKGVIVLINSPDSMEKLPPDQALRTYGLGAQVLVKLSVRKMILLSNASRELVGLEGFGLQVAGYRGLSE